MAIEIVVPRLGWSMDEGTFGEWLVKEGDLVHKGDMLFVLEGDKAAQEIESFDEGILYLPPNSPKPDDAVTVGQLLAFLLAAGESPPDPTQPATVSKSPQSPTTGTRPEPQPQLGPTVISTSSRVISSPRARRTAAALGIDSSKLRGSGRGGRIRERDVFAAAQRLPSSASSKDPVDTPGILQPGSKIRRTIAGRMLAGVQQTAAVTLASKVNASELVAIRHRFKSNRAGTVPSYNDLLVKLVAEILPECPELNACWMDESVYTYHEINIAIAVETEAGLMAPVLRNVAALSLAEIATQSLQLVTQARSGKLCNAQLQGGTFTITNLGMFDVDHFTPIINLPQTAILGIGRIADEPVIAGDTVVPGKTLGLSLTFDHRAIDGAPAARWLQRLTKMIARGDFDVG